jgi:hypothetical protein
LPSSTWNVGNHRRRRLPIGTLIDPKDTQRYIAGPGWRWLSSTRIAIMFWSDTDLSDVEVQQHAAADRRGIDPPIQVKAVMWSKAGQLDWWVKEPQQWLGRVRGKDGRQRWIRAVDLRPAKSE